MKTILFDVDGVLADFVSAYLRILNRQTGRRHVPSDVQRWDFYDVSTWDESQAVWAEIDMTKGLARDLQEYDGMLQVVYDMRTTAHSRIPCTRWIALTAPPSFPCSTWMYDRSEWLKDRGFTNREIVFASDKRLVPGDVLVEDCLANVQAWCDAWPKGWGVLVDRPWNQGLLPKNAARAYCPQDVDRLVRSAL